MSGPREKTPVQGTGQYPVWRQSAREIAAKLLKDYPSDESAARAASCLSLWASYFDLWDDPETRPQGDERKRAIDWYLSVYRASLDLMVRLAVMSRK